MKTELMDDKVEMSPVAEEANGGQAAGVAIPKQGTRVQDLVVAFVLIAIPLLILSWMSHADSSEASSERTCSYIAAVVVLLLSVVGERLTAALVRGGKKSQAHH